MGSLMLNESTHFSDSTSTPNPARSALRCVQEFVFYFPCMTRSSSSNCQAQFLVSSFGGLSLLQSSTPNPARSALRCVQEFVFCFPCMTGSSSSNCQAQFLVSSFGGLSLSTVEELLSILVVIREQNRLQKVMA